MLLGVELIFFFDLVARFCAALLNLIVRDSYVKERHSYFDYLLLLNLASSSNK
jgi:hypothetical protein